MSLYGSSSHINIIVIINLNKEKIMTELTEIDIKISDALARGETSCPEGVPSAKWEMAKAMYASTINSQIQAAQAAQMNQSSTPAPSNIPVVSSPVPATITTGSPAAYTAPKSFDIDEVSQSGLGGVDGYIKLSYGQINVGDKTINNPSFKARIKLSDVIKKLSIRTNNPVKYYSTYDGYNSTEGTPWIQVLQEVQRIDPKARPYTSYEIPMILEENLVKIDFVNGQPVTETILEKGNVVGYTTAVTARKPFEDVLNEIIRKGMRPSECEVVVKVIREDKVKSTQKWAILSYEVLEIINNAAVE